MNGSEIKQFKKLSVLTDEELINEIKSGNKEYFSEIIKRYNQKLFRIAVSYGIIDDDRDEVLQLTYIAAYEKLLQFRGEAKFSTWLIRILINECLMIKRKKAKTTNLSEQEIVTIPADDHLNPQEVYMTKEKQEILEHAIEQLSDKYRSVYVLMEIEGMSTEEAANTLKISKINIKVRLHRAKNMLKDILAGITDVSNLFVIGNERCDRINNTIMDYIMNNEK